MAEQTEFDKALASFVRSVGQTMKYAEVCAIMAIEHFAEHGDLIYAQRFADACPQNFGRKAAFVRWMQMYSPCTYHEGTFKKDKSDDARSFNLDAARKKPYWDAVPDKTVTKFESADIVTALFKTTKKFEGERYEAKSVSALETLKRVQSLLNGLRREIEAEQETLGTIGNDDDAAAVAAV